MARRVRDASLESRAARARLAPRPKPYFKSIGPGLHVGYRKGRNGGRWAARIYRGDGAYVVETMADADDMLDANGSTVLDFWQAQERARQRHADLTAPADRSGPYTVKDALDDYLLWMEGNRKSADNTRYRVNAHISPELGDVEVAELTAKRIREWLQRLATAPGRLRTKPGQQQRLRDLDDDPETIRRRRGSANRTLTILKAALNYAWREGKVDSDSEWRRVQPFEAVDAARVRYLTIAEAQRLVNACDPTFRDLAVAALQTGARYGELAALTVEDFNPDAGTLTIRSSKAGKVRHVVLTDEGVTFFRGITAGREGSTLMFTTKAGDPWRPSNQNRPMREACERAKINPPVGFHALRHIWSSHAVMNGVPLMVVAKNLGHADTRMVERHYGHLAPSYIVDAIRAGAPRFGAPKGNVVPLGGAS